MLLEVAEELREDELRAALDAAGHTEGPVMLVVLLDAEPPSSGGGMPDERDG